MDFPVITVQASLPGASPEIMASSVATPLERSLGSIAGVSQMTSRSSQGSTRIIIQFDLDRDINGAARDVQAAINASRNLLPSGMRSMPTYRKINPSQAPIMVLSLTSEVLGKAELYDIGSTILAQKLSQVSGVGEIQVGGSSLPAVRVELQRSSWSSTVCHWTRCAGPSPTAMCAGPRAWWRTPISTGRCAPTTSCTRRPTTCR